MNRREFCRSLAAGAALAVLPGCDRDGGSIGRLEKVWSRRGLVDGRLWRPRAMDVDAQGNVYIVDFTARIQVFDSEGNFLRGWRTPNFKNGKPTGVTIVGDRLLVADTHYFRMLSYTLEGELREGETIGGVEGHGPGEFGFVTDAVRDSAGAFYIAEYGDYDRIQKFSPEGQFILQWGAHGPAPGEFIRPQNLLVDANDQIWVCDACNHRIQVFDTEGKLLTMWGEEGSLPGQLSYPYDIAIDDQGDVLLVEHGNSRVQKFTAEGESLGIWGKAGRTEGQLDRPWALARDQTGRVHVLDTYNHRVQTIEI
jgi:DNA-binding beta-propeller fold protein YncE